MKQGHIRIIGGLWRGRKIEVPTTLNLRPTPSRVRETLFNWLAPVIPGTYCLDAFAGSGILGFEALSRGAAHVVMIDQTKSVVTLLQKELLMLKAQNNAEIYCGKVPLQLKKPEKLFNIVFLDPPYQDNLLLPTCFYLDEQGFLANQAYIYLEAKETIQQCDLPPHWRLLKSKKAGQVAYHLAQRSV